MRLLTVCALAIGLSACASLPTDQTAAFKTLASGSQAGFAALSGAQADALTTEQLALVASGARTVSPSEGCLGSDQGADPCVLIVSDPSTDHPVPDIVLGGQTPRMQRLLGAISLYAGSMSDLASAKDLAAAAAATGKAAAGLKSLAAVVYPAGAGAAGAAIDALAFGAEQLRVQQRRQLMLKLATEAQPVIDQSAKLLGEEATQLRGSLLDVRKTRLRHAIDALDAYDSAPPDPAAGQAGHGKPDPAKALGARTKLVADVVSAAAAVSEVRTIKTDFTPLSRSHDLMVRALSQPHAGANLTTSVAEAQAFEDALKSMTGLKPSAAPATAPGEKDKDSSDDGK